jgi:hypothetical protein
MSELEEKPRILEEVWYGGQNERASKAPLRQGRASKAPRGVGIHMSELAKPRSSPSAPVLTLPPILYFAKLPDETSNFRPQPFDQWAERINIEPISGQSR